MPFCLLVVDLRWRNSRKARAVGMVRLRSLVEMEFGALRLIGRPVLEAVNRRSMRNKYKQAQKQFFYHVCSYWRTLGFSISSLWSSLCTIWLKMGYTHLVWLWLEKSKSHLLSLFDRSTLLKSQYPTQILELCIAAAFRWRRISVILTSGLQDMFCDLEKNSTCTRFLEWATCWTDERHLGGY